MSGINYITRLSGQAQASFEDRTLIEVATDRTLPAMLRAKAISVIGASGDKTSAVVLDKCFKDSNGVVKSAAYYALKMLNEESKKSFDIDGNAKIKIPDRDTRIKISFWEKLAAYARLEKLTPDQLGALKIAQSTGVSQEILNFLTKSDVRALKVYGIPVVREFDSAEKGDLAEVVKQELSRGKFSTVNIFGNSGQPVKQGFEKGIFDKFVLADRAIKEEQSDVLKQLDRLLSLSDALREADLTNPDEIQLRNIQNLIHDLSQQRKDEVRITAEEYLTDRDIELLKKYKII